MTPMTGADDKVRGGSIRCDFAHVASKACPESGDGNVRLHAMTLLSCQRIGDPQNLILMTRFSVQQTPNRQRSRHSILSTKRRIQGFGEAPQTAADH